MYVYHQEIMLIISERERERYSFDSIPHLFISGRNQANPKKNKMDMIQNHYPIIASQHILTCAKHEIFFTPLLRE